MSAAELNEGERALVGVYERLKAALEEHGDDLSPYQERNALKAVAALWQVVNGLELDPGQLYDLGA